MIMTKQCGACLLTMDFEQLEARMIANFNLWLDEIKALGGYYEQPDENFYMDCWTSGLTPQAVTEYLNQPLEN